MINVLILIVVIVINREDIAMKRRTTVLNYRKIFMSDLFYIQKVIFYPFSKIPI